MFRVRYHLGRGENYMKWQVKDCSTGHIEYKDPEEWSLALYDCTLVNNKRIARTILKGENKTVCAWIECECVGYIKVGYEPKDEVEASVINAFDKDWDESITIIKYNPRKKPHWVDNRGKDIDSSKHKCILTKNRTLKTIES